MCLEALNKEFPISTTHFVRVVIHEVVKSFTQTPTGESFLPFTFIHGSIAFLKYVVGTCFCHHPSLKKSQKQQAAVHHNHLPKISGFFFWHTSRQPHVPHITSQGTELLLAGTDTLPPLLAVAARKGKASAGKSSPGLPARSWRRWRIKVENQWVMGDHHLGSVFQ